MPIKSWSDQQSQRYFEVDGHVQYTKKPPAAPSAPPKFPLNSGTYTHEPNKRVLSSGGYRELARWVFAYVALVGMLCRADHFKATTHSPEAN
jgi:hypothetical protein